MELFRCSLSLLLILKVVNGTVWTQTRDEYIKLHAAYVHNSNKAYYSDILPRPDSTSPVDVTMELEMYAIREFDAAAGALEIVGSVSMTWTDPVETLSTSTTFDTTSVKSLLVNYKKMWTPVIVLVNSADTVKKIGDETYLARFNLTSGVVSWKPRALMRASCTPKVEFFPFDQHICNFVFVPWYQDSAHVRLLTLDGEWRLSKYSDDGIWKKDSTSSSVELIDGYYRATFTIIFSRQPLFFIINVVFPVLLLSVLTGFMFLLPVASGERVGFAITCFLSFILLQQTMLQFFPEISDPMSLFCFYAIIMMIFSGVLSIVNIVLLKVYHKPETEAMPKFLVHFLETIKCVKCRRLNGNADRKTSTGSGADVLPGSDSGSDVSQEEKHVDWTSVGKLLDTFFLILFISVQLVFTLIYLAPLISKA